MKRTVLTKRRRPQRSTVGVSLFPFLAVLICTMGSLILLLVVIARQAQLHAARVAEAETAAQRAEQEKEQREAREDVQWQIEQLRAAREATEAQMAEARLKLGHIEDHARRLREHLARLEAVLADLDQHGADEQRQRGKLEAELVKAKADVEKAEEQLEAARRDVSRRRRSYAVVPYEGRFETRRRPIYIECTDDAVTLQPEGIELSPADFDGPLGPGNPLAAAIRATREYLLAKKEFDPQSVAGEPYPLLLIRPNGVAAYYEARAAMQSWGSEFGYELIGEDWKLKFRKPDRELAAVVRRAVEIARLRQQQLAAAAPRSYRSASTVQYRAGRSHGIVPDGVITSDEGHGSRYGGGGSGNRTGYAGGFRAGRAAGPGRRQPGGSPHDDDGATGPRAGTMARGTSPYDAVRLAGKGKGAGRGTGPGNGTGTGATGGGPIGSLGNGVGGKGPGGPYAEGSNFGTAIPGATGPEGTGRGGSPSTSGGVGMGGGSAGPATSGSMAGAASSPGSSFGGLGGAGEGGTSGSQGPSFGAAGAKRSNSADVPAQGVSLSAVQGDWHEGTPPPETQPGETSSRPDQWRRSPPAAAAAGRASRGFSHRPVHSLASSRGRNWGLPKNGGAIPITRPVRIECYPDRLIIASGRGGAGGKTIPLGQQTESAVVDMVFDVRQRVETWGIAGDGMYWRPVLNVYVAPGAEQRFEDLNLLLEDSGLNVQRKQ